MEQVGPVVQRPWGTYQMLAQGERWRTKILVVQPGKYTSMQRHLHRDEAWTIVEGTGTLDTLGDAKTLRETETVRVRRMDWHMIYNHGKIPLVIVETWTGEYLSEDDIERYGED